MSTARWEKAENIFGCFVFSIFLLIFLSGFAFFLIYVYIMVYINLRKEIVYMTYKEKLVAVLDPAEPGAMLCGNDIILSE